jgi:hypothetical protein
MENGGGGTTEGRSGSSSYQVMRMAIAIGGSHGIEGEIRYSSTLHFTGWS